MEERVYIGLLLDYYGGLLTENQRTTLELYYTEDLTLSEIGESTGITRQGARDAIKRGETALRRAEEQAGMVKRYMAFRQAIEELETHLEQVGDEKALSMLQTALEIWENE